MSAKQDFIIKSYESTNDSSWISPGNFFPMVQKHTMQIGKGGKKLNSPVQTQHL